MSNITMSDSKSTTRQPGPFLLFWKHTESQMHAHNIGKLDNFYDKRSDK